MWEIREQSYFFLGQWRERRRSPWQKINKDQEASESWVPRLPVRSAQEKRRHFFPDQIHSPLGVLLLGAGFAHWVTSRVSEQVRLAIRSLLVDSHEARRVLSSSERIQASSLPTIYSLEKFDQLRKVNLVFFF